MFGIMHSRSGVIVSDVPWLDCLQCFNTGHNGHVMGNQCIIPCSLNSDLCVASKQLGGGYFIKYNDYLSINISIKDLFLLLSKITA